MFTPKTDYSTDKYGECNVYRDVAVANLTDLRAWFRVSLNTAHHLASSHQNLHDVYLQKGHSALYAVIRLLRVSCAPPPPASIETLTASNT
jgi:hypothetical protein